ncbi:uncharacterized protein LOC120335633 isoform X1 [Styela clava]
MYPALQLNGRKSDDVNCSQEKLYLTSRSTHTKYQKYLDQTERHGYPGNHNLMFSSTISSNNSKKCSIPNVLTDNQHSGVTEFMNCPSSPLHEYVAGNCSRKGNLSHETITMSSNKSDRTSLINKKPKTAQSHGSGTLPVPGHQRIYYHHMLPTLAGSNTSTKTYSNYRQEPNHTSGQQCREPLAGTYSQVMSNQQQPSFSYLPIIANHITNNKQQTQPVYRSKRIQTSNFEPNFSRQFPIPPRVINKISNEQPKPTLLNYGNSQIKCTQTKGPSVFPIRTNYIPNEQLQPSERNIKHAGYKTQNLSLNTQYFRQTPVCQSIRINQMPRERSIPLENSNWVISPREAQYSSFNQECLNVTNTGIAIKNPILFANLQSRTTCKSLNKEVQRQCDGPPNKRLRKDVQVKATSGASSENSPVQQKTSSSPNKPGISTDLWDLIKSPRRPRDLNDDEDISTFWVVDPDIWEAEQRQRHRLIGDVVVQTSISENRHSKHVCNKDKGGDGTSLRSALDSRAEATTNSNPSAPVESKHCVKDLIAKSPSDISMQNLHPQPKDSNLSGTDSNLCQMMSPQDSLHFNDDDVPTFWIVDNDTWEQEQQQQRKVSVKNVIAETLLSSPNRCTRDERQNSPFENVSSSLQTVKSQATGAISVTSGPIGNKSLTINSKNEFNYKCCKHKNSSARSLFSNSNASGFSPEPGKDERMGGVEESVDSDCEQMPVIISCYSLSNRNESEKFVHDELHSKSITDKDTEKVLKDEEAVFCGEKYFDIYTLQTLCCIALQNLECFRGINRTRKEKEQRETAPTPNTNALPTSIFKEPEICGQEELTLTSKMFPLENKSIIQYNDSKLITEMLSNDKLFREIVPETILHQSSFDLDRKFSSDSVGSVNSFCSNASTISILSIMEYDTEYGERNMDQRSKGDTKSYPKCPHVAVSPVTIDERKKTNPEVLISRERNLFDDISFSNDLSKQYSDEIYNPDSDKRTESDLKFAPSTKCDSAKSDSSSRAKQVLPKRKVVVKFNTIRKKSALNEKSKHADTPKPPFISRNQHASQNMYNYDVDDEDSRQNVLKSDNSHHSPPPLLYYPANGSYNTPDLTFRGSGCKKEMLKCAVSPATKSSTSTVLNMPAKRQIEERNGVVSKPCLTNKVCNERRATQTTSSSADQHDEIFVMQHHINAEIDSCTLPRTCGGSQTYLSTSPEDSTFERNEPKRDGPENGEIVLKKCFVKLQRIDDIF